MPKPIKPNIVKPKCIKWTKPKFKVGEKVIAVIESSYGKHTEVVHIEVSEIVDLYAVGYEVICLHKLYSDGWNIPEGKTHTLYFEWIEKYPLLKQKEVIEVLSRLPNADWAKYGEILLSQLERINATDETPEKVIFT